MDPSQLDGASLIVGALAAGAAEGLKDTAKQAVIAFRDKLVHLLKPRFHDDEDAEADPNVYLRRPTPENAGPLAGHIVAAGLDRDEEILSSSRHLLDVAGPTATGAGSIAAQSIRQINTNGATGFFDGQHVHHHEASTPASAADGDVLHLRGSVFELRNVDTGSAHDAVLEAPGAVRFDPPDEDLSLSAARRPAILGWW